MLKDKALHNPNALPRMALIAKDLSCTPLIGNPSMAGRCLQRIMPLPEGTRSLARLLHLATNQLNVWKLKRSRTNREEAASQDAKAAVQPPEVASSHASRCSVLLARSCNSLRINMM
mmetsp:Transcript_13218/g.33357  ORF Transcript_13218/g.33357 Transcript_13218/m.33357 type:complete len:117 (+) Transcript_13218:196-546(+)